MKLAKKHRGDTPCSKCGTTNNPVWFTDNSIWNEVMGSDKHKILCVNCFISKAEKQYDITGWKILPEFKK